MREYLAEHIEKPMGLDYFNYGLKPEYRADVAMNYATGMHPGLGTDRYLKHVWVLGYKPLWTLPMTHVSWTSSALLATSTPVQSSQDVF